MATWKTAGRGGGRKGAGPRVQQSADPPSPPPFRKDRPRNQSCWLCVDMASACLPTEGAARLESHSRGGVLVWEGATPSSIREPRLTLGLTEPTGHQVISLPSLLPPRRTAGGWGGVGGSL